MTVIRSEINVRSKVIARIHLSRPERLNALGITIATALEKEIKTVAATINSSRSINGVILTAETVTKNAKKIWIAGGDLKELAALGSTKEATLYAATMRRAIEALDHLPIPVAVFIDGDAIGGGAELAIAGDIRMATLSSQFNWKQLSIGLPTGYGSTRRLCHLIGGAKAQSLIYGIQTLNASSALQLGLLDHVVADFDDAFHTFEKYLQIEPIAWAAQKKLFTRTLYDTQSDPESADRFFASAWRNPTHAQFLKSYEGRN